MLMMLMEAARRVGGYVSLKAATNQLAWGPKVSERAQPQLT